MIDEKLFVKIADTNFHIFEITSLKDIETIYKIYPRKEMIRELMKEKVLSKYEKMELPEKTTIEIHQKSTNGLKTTWLTTIFFFIINIRN